MLADWKPSLRMESHCLLLVDMRKHRFLSCARSALVMKPAPLGCMDVSIMMITRNERCTHQTLLHRFFDLLNFDFGEAANLEQVLAVLCMDSLEHDNQSLPID